MTISLSKTRSKANELKKDLQVIKAALKALPREKQDGYRKSISLYNSLESTIQRLDDLYTELAQAEGANLFK